MQLPVLREAYFKLYSCIRMEISLRRLLQTNFFPLKVNFFFIFFFPLTSLDVKNGYYILTRGDQICVIKLSAFFLDK